MLRADDSYIGIQRIVTARLYAGDERSLGRFQPEPGERHTRVNSDPLDRVPIAKPAVDCVDDYAMPIADDERCRSSYRSINPIGDPGGIALHAKTIAHPDAAQFLAHLVGAKHDVRFSRVWELVPLQRV